jgi:hypothetical protein
VAQTLVNEAAADLPAELVILHSLVGPDEEGAWHGLQGQDVRSLIQEGKEGHQPVPSDIGCVPGRARSRYSTVEGAYLQHSGRLPVTRGHFSTAR